MANVSELFLHGILFGISIIFCLFAGFLEYLKFKQATLGLKIFQPYPLSRFRRRLIGYACGVLVLGLFIFGHHFLFLNQQPFLFVLYWWFTFSLGLCLFFIPALDVRDILKETQNVTTHRSLDPKRESQNIIVRMVQASEEKHGETPWKESSSEDGEENGGPTLH